MKTNLFKILAIFFAFGMFALTSCDTPDPDQQSAEDDARGGYMMADAFAVSNDNAGISDGNKSIVEGMVVDTKIPGKTVITFTNSTYNGVVRNGIINIDYSFAIDADSPRALNLTISFENYTMDGVSLEGTISTIFGGTYLRPSITVEADNMVATFSNGETLVWSSTKVYTLEDGFINDKVGFIISMSGTSEGINRKGNNFSSVYTNVKLNRECPDSKYPVSGIVTIESDKGTTIINYGDGECDNKISVTNSGVTVDLTLD